MYEVTIYSPNGTLVERSRTGSRRNANATARDCAEALGVGAVGRFRGVSGCGEECAWRVEADGRAYHRNPRVRVGL